MFVKSPSNGIDTPSGVAGEGVDLGCKASIHRDDLDLAGGEAGYLAHHVHDPGSVLVRSIRGDKGPSKKNDGAVSPLTVRQPLIFCSLFVRDRLK